MNTRGTALDLFAGIGGMTLAAESVGLQIVEAVGNLKKEANLYQHNFGQRPYMVTDGTWTDFSVELPETDYLFGSIPCSHYSIAGNRKWFGGRREYWELDYLCGLLQIRAPKGFVVTLAAADKQGISELTERSDQSGYRVYRQCIESGAVTGMPVYDKRIYLVGIRKDLHTCFRFSEISNGNVYSVSELRQKGKENPKLFIEPSKIVRDPKAEIYNCRYVEEKENGKGRQMKYTADRYIRYGAWNPSALNDGQRIRKITVRELARTKFFPDEFEFDGMGDSAAYQAIGKSVNVYVAAQVINQLCMAVETFASNQYDANQDWKSERWQEERIDIQERKLAETDEKKSLPEGEEFPAAQISGGQEETEGNGKVGEKAKHQRIFLSYCQKDAAVANLIEEKLSPFIKRDFHISRDIREVSFRESFKKYMDSARDHEYIMMIISDSYLRSVNCMYEVTEAFKDKDFERKILFFVLSEDDRKYYREDAPDVIAADIYNSDGQTRYILHWQAEEEKIGNEIQQIREPVYTRQLAERLTRIRRIETDLPEFFAYFSDAKGLPLETHLQTDFKELRDIIYKDVSCGVDESDR